MIEVEKSQTSIIAESFRNLKTNIQYSSLDKKYKVIVITSANPNEGKTFVSSNLALTLSEGNKKVVLVDCDFRKANIHRKFKISNSIGLSEILVGQETIESVIEKYNDSLDIITSGHMPPNPSEALASEKMSNFLEDLKSKYDYIILDTPPILFVSDSQVLAAKADGTILVAKSGKTKKNEIKEAYMRLKSINAYVIGTVFNGVKLENKKYKYGIGEK